MSGLNKVQLIGRLGKDPETRYTGSGKAVCNFNLATDESFKKDGEKVQKTEWHRIVLWEKLAEIAQEYLKKGSQVYIEGKLQTRSWDDDGTTKYTTEIVGYSLLMLGGKSESNDEEEAPKKPPKKAAKKQSVISDEDLPF